MALTKLNFYLAIIGILVAMSVTFMSFGQDLLGHQQANINDRSEQYINDYSGYVQSSDISKINDSTVEQRKTSLTGSTNQSGSFSISDVLAATNFYIERVDKVTGFLKTVYNFPSFLVLSLGLPIGELRDLINITTLLLFIGLAVTVLGLIRGTKGT